ncbi:44784_t:CDS:2, partial [Gigaspora margarita]
LEHPSKRPGRQEVLSERNKRALVRIANNNCRAPLTKNEWQNVIFSDESRFCLYKLDGRERVWRRVTEKYHREYINTTVKYGGGSGVGPLVEVKGNMNSDSYVNVLANYFISWVNSLLEKYLDEIKLIFQQDLAPIHTSAYSEWWMKSHGFDILEWVPYSPDLNPIENL